MIGSANGHVLECVVSRLRAMEAQAQADPQHRFQLHFRFVALSACLANARSLAGWLGVEKGLFSFHSSVKVQPLQIRVQDFDIVHAGTRLLAMSKPVYTAVAALSADKAAVVIVPSRKQAQMTAIDILTFVSASVRPRRFTHIPEVVDLVILHIQDQLQSVLDSVVDPALKTVLKAGVAFYYKVSGVSV